MVVVSHLFFFFDKKFGESVTRYESHPPSLELSISRQPLPLYFILQISQSQADKIIRFATQLYTE